MRLEANKRNKLLLREKRVSAGAWLTMGLKRTDNRVTLQNKPEVSAFWNTTQHIGRVVYVRTAVSLRILLWNELMQAQHITRISSMGKSTRIGLEWMKILDLWLCQYEERELFTQTRKGV